MKRLGALDARSLAWLAFAHEILGLPRQAVRWEADVLAAAAQGLAACRPYMVRLEDVSVQVLAWSRFPGSGALGGSPVSETYALRSVYASAAEPTFGRAQATPAMQYQTAQ